MQVTASLAVAESACEFEHRDLHWFVLSTLLLIRILSFSFIVWGVLDGKQVPMMCALVYKWCNLCCFYNENRIMLYLLRKHTSYLLNSCSINFQYLVLCKMLKVFFCQVQLHKFMWSLIERVGRKILNIFELGPRMWLVLKVPVGNPTPVADNVMLFYIVASQF